MGEGIEESQAGIRLRRLERRLTRYLAWLLQSLQKEVEVELDRSWSVPEGHRPGIAETKGAVWKRLRAEQVAFHKVLQRICHNLRPQRHDEARCFDLVRSFVRSRRDFLLKWIQSSGPFPRRA